MDPVNEPPHYRHGSIECIDAIRSALGEGFESYCVGQVLKYCWRYKHKGKPLEDIRKASYYLDMVVGLMEAKEVKEDGMSDN
jgi:hypothetical protein